MSPHDSNCEAIRVLDERITRERELRQELEKRLDERDRRYEDRFQSQDEKTTLALTASKEAIGKAESATEKRFDAVNEFRGTLSDQASTLLPRSEANTRFSTLDEKAEEIKKELASLRESRSAGEGSTRISSVLWAIGASILTAGLGAVLVYVLLKGLK